MKKLGFNRVQPADLCQWTASISQKTEMSYTFHLVPRKFMPNLNKDIEIMNSLYQPTDFEDLPAHINIDQYWIVDQKIPLSKLCNGCASISLSISNVKTKTDDTRPSAPNIPAIAPVGTPA